MGQCSVMRDQEAFNTRVARERGFNTQAARSRLSNKRSIELSWPVSSPEIIFGICVTWCFVFLKPMERAARSMESFNTRSIR